MRFGPNLLARTRAVSAWRILQDQLTSIVVLQLAAAAIITLVLANYVETGAIVAVLVLHTAIGFVTEPRARRAMEALPHLGVARALPAVVGQAIKLARYTCDEAVTIPRR